MLGSLLRQREQQYVAVRDDKGTWRILDTFHKALEPIGPDDEIPDSSPAVVVLTEGGFIALVKEATRLEIIQNATLGIPDSEKIKLEAAIEHYKSEYIKIKEELDEQKKKGQYSEEFVLKKLKIETVLKVLGLEALDEIK